MNLSDICQRLKSLVYVIITTEKELNEARETSHLKVRESVPLFVNALKKVAPIQIQHSGILIGMIGGKKLVWHKEHGIGVADTPTDLSQAMPLTIPQGDFPIETLVQTVQSQLDTTLQCIQSKKDQEVKRTEQLENFITILKQWNEN